MAASAPRLPWTPVDRRIFGLENEYGVTCTFRGQRRLSPDEVARYLFRRVVSWGRSSNVFLENGARLYLDVGSHPEYATPECDSIEDLVAHDKAGERILEGLIASAESRLSEEGIRGVIYLFKNNTDSAGNSYGCHENYLTSRRDDFSHFVQVLIPFFVSRQIYSGAGKVLQTARGATFCLLSARRAHLGRGLLGHDSAVGRSSTPGTSRTPTAGALRRLHVIVGDSNMSEYATFLKVGATSILLRMLEDRDVVIRELTAGRPPSEPFERSAMTSPAGVKCDLRTDGSSAPSTSSTNTWTGRFATTSCGVCPPWRRVPCRCGGVLQPEASREGPAQLGNASVTGRSSIA